jgi:phenylalanyl-tRNA synthetase alpha chain
MKDLITKLLQEAKEEIHNSESLANLEELKVKYLGRKGAFTAIMQGLKDVSKEEKPVLGQLLNQAKQTLEFEFDATQQDLEKTELDRQLNDDTFDITRPGVEFNIGHIHPLSQVQKDVEEIFGQMGFAVADGPEVESEHYNFEALNVPKDHPARDMQDTFFIADKHHNAQGRMVLRTQTSPVQIRSMEKYGAPLRLIVPGRVFRYEATDASHDSTFYQVEGLLIDKDISLANLKGVMTEFLTRLFKKETKVRFRPGYFPFVEPGIELDMWCLLCSGNGCRVCKHTGWMEFMGAGMVHRNVLKAGGIDPDVYKGWAFGFGLTRLVMMKYGIDDIRHLMNGDLRFLDQF